jgi:DNA-binding XRE family transcriptional regulator
MSRAPRRAGERIGTTRFIEGTLTRKRPAGPNLPDQYGLTVVDGRRLRQLRLQRRLTQLDLADCSGVSTYTISKLESKPGSRCRDSTVAALALALDAPAASLRDVTDPAFAGFKVFTPRASKNGTGGR